MSHFVGLCFGEGWENNLDRYDENLEVAGYITHTKLEAIEYAKDIHKRHYNHAIEVIDNPDYEYDKKYYQDIIDIGPELTNVEAWKRIQEWGYEIDDEENLISHYNPDSRWDWYVIGGRWDGFLILKELDEEGEHIKTNEAYINEIDWDLMVKENNIPFCFIDVFGEWHERGEMGWFTSVKNEKDIDVWKQHFLDYIKELEDDCLVTVVDFHI